MRHILVSSGVQLCIIPNRRCNYYQRPSVPHQSTPFASLAAVQFATLATIDWSSRLTKQRLQLKCQVCLDRYTRIPRILRNDRYSMKNAWPGFSTKYISASMHNAHAQSIKTHFGNLDRALFPFLNGVVYFLFSEQYLPVVQFAP